MKKFLLSFCLCFVALVGMAQKVYNENIVVEVNGEVTPPVPAEITVTENGDGTCNFLLKDFKLTADLPVGNINVQGVKMEAAGASTKLSADQNITILPGDDPTVPADQWLGPLLGEIPIKMNGKMNDAHLFTSLDINLELLQMVIKVTIGEDFADEAAGVSYKENLIVSVNGQNSPLTPADINVKDAADGKTCELTLRNFSLRSVDPAFPDFVSEIHVGNIVLTGVQMTEENGVQTLSTEQNITIQPGDDPNLKPQDWFGPMLGEVPVKMTGTKTADQLTASINIEMMGMKIAVAIGEMTTSFQESLLVTLNGNEGIETPADIVVYRDLDKEACDLTLKNFILRSVDPTFPDFVQEMPVGTIVLKDVKLEALPVSDSLSTEQNIVILPGDKEGSKPTDWLGPMLGEVPVKMTGMIHGSRLDAKINIEMMGMQIEVVIGKDAETGITDVTVTDVKVAKGVYNLNGIRVADELDNSLPAGLYIVNGKKVIVK